MKKKRDIVERLRNDVTWADRDEAAAEIEQLRAELATLRAERDQWQAVAIDYRGAKLATELDEVDKRFDRLAASTLDTGSET